MNWTEIVIALVSTGGLGTTVAAVRKAWKAQESAGYQRRVKEEQAEEALQTISELESEVEMRTSRQAELESRLLTTEQFAAQQQQIIARQAEALSRLGAGEGVAF